MTTMDELKPCPFCGEIPELIYLDNYGYCYYCGDTHIGTHYCEVGNNKTEAKAAKVWNTRPAEDALTAEVERLKNKLKELKECIIDSRDKYIKLTEHEDFTTATISFGAYNLLNSFIEIINAPDMNVATKESEGKE